MPMILGFGIGGRKYSFILKEEEKKLFVPAGVEGKTDWFRV